MGESLRRLNAETRSSQRRGERKISGAKSLAQRRPDPVGVDAGRRERKTEMAIRTVLQLGDPGLREVANRVENPAAPEILALVEDLTDTLAYWRKTTGYGRAIAAPQIGAGVRVILLRLPGEEPWPLVNPVITERSKEKMVVWDACLSFLSIFMQVERHREISVRYQNLSCQPCEVHAGEERNLSELLQHEIDHLDGILAVDRITDIRTMCTREQFEKRYRAGSPYAVEAAGKEAPNS
jgi:peptide deformylase